MIYFLSTSYIVQLIAVLFLTDLIVSNPINSKTVSDKIFDVLNSSQCKIPSKNRDVILAGSGIKQHRPDMKGSIASHCSKPNMPVMIGETVDKFVSLNCNAMLSESIRACKILTTEMDEIMIDLDVKVGTVCETLTRPTIKSHLDKALCSSQCNSRNQELCLSLYYIEQLVIQLNKINQGTEGNADQSEADVVPDNQRNIVRLPSPLNGTSSPAANDLSGVPGAVVTGDVVDRQSSTASVNNSERASTNSTVIGDANNLLPQTSGAGQSALPQEAPLVDKVMPSSAVVTSKPQQQQDSNKHTDAVPNITRNATGDSLGKTEGPPLVETPTANSSETDPVPEENIQGPKTHLTDVAADERVVNDGSIESPVDGVLGAHDEFDDGTSSNPNLEVVEHLPKLEKQPTQPLQREEQPLQRGEQPLQREEQPPQRGEQPLQRGEQPLQREEQPLQRGEQPLQREEQPFQRGEQPTQPLQPSSDANAMTNLQQPAVRVGSYEGAAQPQSNFFAYFLTVIILCIVCYLVFHNKKKILALLIEGRQSRGRRRGRSTEYRKLNTGEGSLSDQQRREVTNNIIY